MADDNEVLSVAAESASYSMLVQLIFRVLTFVLNGVMLRYISRELLGVVNVRLMLLYTTIQFLVSEPFMRACLSKTRDGKRVWHQIINLVWFAVPLGLTMALILGSVWIYLLERPDENLVSYYNVGVICYCLSAVIETLAQPLIVTSQVLLHVRLKILIEGGSLALRCVLAVSLVIFKPEWGLLSFCAAHLLYSSMITASYYLFFLYRIHKSDKKNQKRSQQPITCIRDFFPRKREGFSYINQEQATLTWSFARQSFLKQILTEGERYLMTVFGILSFPDQGVYDVINNLGSLVARFLFLPVEDGFYLFITQTTLRGQKAVTQSPESMKLALQLLQTLLKLMLIIGLIFITFGYSYSFLLLDIYGGSTLSGSWGPTLLRWYCLYVFVISINGITEGFKNATMSSSQVNRYNRMMFYFAVFFLCSAYLLTWLFGSVGFILANCLNMSARIVHSFSYMRDFFDEYPSDPFSALRLNYLEIAVFASAAIFCAISERLFCCEFGLLHRLLHISVGGFFFLVVVATIWFNEREIVSFIRDKFNKHKTETIEQEKKRN